MILLRILLIPIKIPVAIVWFISTLFITTPFDYATQNSRSYETILIANLTHIWRMF